MANRSGRHVPKRCALQEPYPTVKAVTPNHYYADLLLEDYTGAVSELTAINQYLYHHFTFGNYPDLSELERCISIVEMHHLDLLAGVILLLGVEPQFRTFSTCGPLFWNAANIHYGTGVCDKLTADIRSEVQAIQNYRRHQELIDDVNIKSLLERIIRDEEYHYQLFCEAYQRYCPQSPQ